MTLRSAFGNIFNEVARRVDTDTLRCYNSVNLLIFKIDPNLKYYTHPDVPCLLFLVNGWS